MEKPDLLYKNANVNNLFAEQDESVKFVEKNTVSSRTGFKVLNLIF